MKGFTTIIKTDKSNTKMEDVEMITIDFCDGEILQVSKKILGGKNLDEVEKITLETCDRKVFEIPKILLEGSATIKNLVDSFGDEHKIPLMNVNKKMLRYILEFYSHEHVHIEESDEPIVLDNSDTEANSDSKTTETTSESNEKTDDITEEAKEKKPEKPKQCDGCEVFFKQVQMDNPTIIDFINAANYLNCREEKRDLIVLSCREVALRIKEKVGDATDKVTIRRIMLREWAKPGTDIEATLKRLEEADAAKEAEAAKKSSTETASMSMTSPTETTETPSMSMTSSTTESTSSETSTTESTSTETTTMSMTSTTTSTESTTTETTSMSMTSTATSTESTTTESTIDVDEKVKTS